MKKEVAETPEVKQPKPEADEKILAGTLLSEIEANSPLKKVDVPTPKIPTPEIEVTPPADISEKKEFHWPKLPFKRPKDTVSVPESPAPTKAQKSLSPSEQITTEALFKMIDEKTKQISGDEFLTIKISKQGMLILTGLILILIWVIPFLNPNFLNRPSNQSTPMEPVKTDSGVTPPVETKPRIRVRLQTNTLEAAQKIKGILTAAGFTDVDYVYDKDVNANTVLVAAREENDALRLKLESLFAPTHTVASESAVLTDDSDFDATILVGSNSELLD